MFRERLDERRDRSARSRPPPRPGRSSRPRARTERYQFGGSFGGPIVKNKAHFFLAAERTDQTTQQILNIESLFAGFNKPPEAKDGVYDLPMTENLFTVKSSINVSAEPVPVDPLRPEHQLAGLRRRLALHTRQLGRQHEHVQLDQRQPQLGARRQQAERVHLPVRRLRELHPRPRHRARAELPERRRRSA